MFHQPDIERQIVHRRVRRGVRNRYFEGAPVAGEAPPTPSLARRTWQRLGRVGGLARRLLRARSRTGRAVATAQPHARSRGVAEDFG